MNNEEKPKKNPLQTGGSMMRQIDKLASESLPFLGKSWTFVARTRVKTWQGLFMLAFVSGAFVSFVWSVSLEIESLSKASGQATLSMTSPQGTSYYPSIVNINQDETFEVDLVLDTGGVDAVATRAIVSYIPTNFQLTNWDVSESIFGVENTCVYQGNPCQIVDNDTANGRFSITLAKPAPGVNTHSGLLATLTFRALQQSPSPVENILYTFEGSDDATDSDVIEAGGTGNDLLNSATGLRAVVGAPLCTSYTYSDWETCQSNGTQTRTATGVPAGCSGGVDPEETTRTCTYVPPTCTSFTESGFGACQPNGTQTQTVTGVPAGCTGGNPPASSQSCTYIPPADNTCTSFTYSDWGKCTKGKQTRSILTSSPSGCTGGSPVVEQSCKGRKVKVMDTTISFSSKEKVLTSSKTISFSGSDEALLGGGKVELYREGKLKTTVSAKSDGSWSTKVKEKKNDTYEYKVRYLNASGGEIEVSATFRVKIDSEDPEITDLPLFFMIGRGEKLWWDAKDNDEIDHYRYVFLGKSNSTKSKSFNVPADAPTGLHTFQLTAYDEAGNRTVKRILIRVR